MATKTKKRDAAPAEPEGVFEDFDAMTDIITRSMTSAAKKAIAENDELGIESVGSVGGKLTTRKPTKKSPHP